MAAWPTTFEQVTLLPSQSLHLEALVSLLPFFYLPKHRVTTWKYLRRLQSRSSMFRRCWRQ